MKKLFATILIFTLVVSLMGCGKAKSTITEKEEITSEKKANKKENKEVKEEKKEEKEEKESLDPVELTWYYIGNGQQQDTELVESKVNEYIKDKINASIKLQCFDWGSYDEKIKTMIASGEEFDICFTSSWSNNYFDQAVKGAFIPLNDMLDKYAPKTKAQLGDDFLNGSQINGINYAIPANKEKAHQWGFVLREDLVKKYDMDITKIKSLEDIEPFLKIIKENEPGVYGLEAAGLENPRMMNDFDDITSGVVLEHDSKDMKVQLIWETDKMKKYLKTIHRFYNEKYIREDAATIQDFNADESAGKIFAAVKALKPGKDKEMSIATGQPWVQVAITQPIIARGDTVGSMQAISRKSKNPERALMFLEIFNTDPYVNNLINFGIENVHYKKINDTTIKMAEQNSRYNPAVQWMFGNVFINYLYENEDPKKWDKFILFNETARPSNCLGFVFNPKPIKNEIAACSAAAEDYEAGLTTGTLDPEECLPKIIDALHKANIDKVLEECQSQLDQWIKRNK